MDFNSIHVSKEMPQFTACVMGKQKACNPEVVQIIISEVLCNEKCSVKLLIFIFKPVKRANQLIHIVWLSRSRNEKMARILIELHLYCYTLTLLFWAKYLTSRSHICTMRTILTIDQNICDN